MVADEWAYVGLCANFLLLPPGCRYIGAALEGIRQVVADVVADMQHNGEALPTPFAEEHYSGEFRVRIHQLHRALASTSKVLV